MRDDVGVILELPVWRFKFSAAKKQILHTLHRRKNCNCSDIWWLAPSGAHICKVAL